MAARYFLNIGTNWGDTANWSDTSGGSGGFSVPTSADDVFFDVNSGNCDVNASARSALTLDFTGYTNTITMTNQITVSGNITLDSSMTVAGTGILRVAVTATLTSNGKTWPNTLQVGVTSFGSFTYTFADNWTVGDLTGGNHVNTCNGNTIYVTGTLNPIILRGTTNIEMTGTGDLTGNITNNLNINTAGTITVIGTLTYTIGTLTYTTGTVITTGSILSIGTVDLDTDGIIWDTVLITNSGAFAVTLISDLNISGVLLKNDAFATRINGSSINLSGSLSINAGILLGTSNIIMDGTGTWSGAGETRLSINFNTAGALTISGTIYYSTGTLTYTAGTVTTTGSTLSLTGGCTLDVAGINWNNINHNSTGTYTFLDDCIVLGNFTYSGFPTATFNGAFTIYVGGNFSYFQTLGTTTIVMDGTGTISGQGTIQNDFIINTAGTITFSGTNNFATKTLTYTAGTVVTTSSTFQIGQNATLNVSSITWNNVISTAAGTTCTLLSDLNVGGNYTTSTSIIFSGAFNINVSGNLTINNTTSSAAGSILNLIGTGIWSGTGSLLITTNINTAGTITISGAVNYGTGTLTYIAGTVITTGSTLQVVTTSTLDIGGINLNHFSSVLNGIITLSSNLYVLGNWRANGSHDINNNNFYLGGNIQTDNGSRVNGTSLLIYNGTGTWSSGSSNGHLGLNFELNTTGELKLAIALWGSLTISNLTFTYVQGNMTTLQTDSYLGLVGSTNIFDTNSLIIPRLTFNAMRPLTLLSDLNVKEIHFNSSLAWFSSASNFKVYVHNNIYYSWSLGGVTWFLSTSTALQTITSPTNVEIVLIGDQEHFIGIKKGNTTSIATIQTPFTINCTGPVTFYRINNIQNSFPFYENEDNTIKNTIDYISFAGNGNVINIINIGPVVCKNIGLHVYGNLTLNGLWKIPFSEIQLVHDYTYTMDKFFSNNYNNKIINIYGLNTINEPNRSPIIIINENCYSHYTTIQNVQLSTSSKAIPIVTYRNALKSNVRGFILSNPLANDLPENDYQDPKTKTYENMNAFPVLNY